jgi:integrase
MAKHKGSRRANGTGGIFRDGDGWRVRVAAGVNPKTGKVMFRSTRAKTQAEAVEALRRLEAARSAGKLAPAKGATVETFLTFWLENIKANRAPKTYRQYAWIVKDHVLPHLGAKKVDKVTRLMIQALLTSKATQTVKPKAKDPKTLPTKTLSPATLGHIRSVLRAAFQDALRDGLATMNPVEHVEVPTQAKKPPIYLDPIQAAALFRAASECDLSELFRFMLSTGTRIGEATGIRWQDLDLDRGFVFIRGQLQRIEGKLTYRAITKTNQDRALPISHSMVEALKGLKTAQMINGMEDPDGIVFLNAEGRRLDPKFVSKRLAGVCRKAEVPVVSPHKLRHTAATLALAETGDLHGVQKMLGHQQVALTANLYGHATAETLRSVTNAIEKSLGS